MVAGFSFKREEGERQLMAGLSQDEKIAKLQPELQSLLDSRKVEPAIQASLYDSGVDSMGMLAAISISREELKNFAKDSLGVDTTARPEDVVKFATLFLAWQSATNRVRSKTSSTPSWHPRSSQNPSPRWKCFPARASLRSSTIQAQR